MDKKILEKGMKQIMIISSIVSILMIGGYGLIYHENSEKIPPELLTPVLYSCFSLTSICLLIFLFSFISKK